MYTSISLVLCKQVQTKHYRLTIIKSNLCLIHVNKYKLIFIKIKFVIYNYKLTLIKIKYVVITGLTMYFVH
jgi:hypothetical protein